MKKNLIKKVFAVSLSIAMACSFLPAANPVTASAAAPFVSLKTTFKTLKVGQKYKMTLKNNTINWKIKKVETTDKTIATVYGKTTSQVMIKGKSEGRATIRVKVKTSKRKANNTKTLRCRVKVVTDSPVVNDPTTPTQTDATVTTPQELSDALNNTSITKITIKPTTAQNFTIPSGSYSNVDLIVDAPLSDIENSATFKSITIENIKPETWTEKGTGNSFIVRAKAARIVVDKTASVKSISIGTTDAKLSIDVQGGIVGGITVSAKVDLTLTGTTAEGAAAIPVTFTATATEATLTTALKVAVSTLAKIVATFEKGAEDSTIKLETSGISATVTNNTTKAIEVTLNNGNVQTVRDGIKGSTINAVTSGTGTGTWTPSGSGNGNYTPVSNPATDNHIVTEGAIRVGMGLYDVKTPVTVTGSAVVVSEGAISYWIEGIEAVTPAAIEYRVTAKSATGTDSVGYYGSWQNMNRDTRSGDYYNTYYVEEQSINIKGARFGEDVELTFEFRVAADNTYSAGKISKATCILSVSDSVNGVGTVSVKNGLTFN